MKLFIVSALTIIIISCSSKQSNKSVTNKIDSVNPSLAMDSCLNNLYIDKSSAETKVFDKFWSVAKKLGYTFSEDTTVPFIKIIFRTRSSRFYIDTLIIADCKILDSLNIHKIQMRSSKQVNKKYHPDINIEEWQFKDSSAAISYGKALSNYINKGYGLKSPMAVMQKTRSIYIFNTAAYMFISEMERMEKALDPTAKIFAINY
ncbi:MAG: hypothetical protein ABI405_04075 [Parafilimonas sp.]